ncbi:MAG: hypothetical protein ACHRHE_24390 [Tepidisphaerales bacterium]
MPAVIVSPVWSRVALPAAVLAHRQSSDGFELSAISRFQSVFPMAFCALQASACIEACGMQTSACTTQHGLLLGTRCETGNLTVGRDFLNGRGRI